MRWPNSSLAALSVALLFVGGNAVPPAGAADSDQLGPTPAVYQQTASRAIEYLRAAQADDGSFSSHAGPGITAVVAAGLLRHGRTPDDPTVARALAYLESLVQEDGGIYQPGSRYRNYETCLAIMCLTEANRFDRYTETVQRAEQFVKELQWDEGEGQQRSDMNYGGAGYGSHKRPDLSNTSFFVDALKAAGNGPDDPALQRALYFVSRCQNLETEHNTTPFAAAVNDGGFYYTCAAGGTSQAGQTPDGGLRSYGSMTYAGLKSMIYAGVGPDDPRVKAAYDWIRRNYTLDENPGMGGAGLYYYYHTFAKALDAYGVDVVEDENGVTHDWRRELVQELAAKQSDRGSWTNANDRWLEGDPNLVTGYVLLALSYCQPQ